MKDKAPWHWAKYRTRYIAERGVNVLDWPGNSVDSTPIWEVWSIMKKKSGTLPNDKKKSFGITFVSYGMIFIDKQLRNCMMKSLQWWKLCAKLKVNLPCTELSKTMVQRLRMTK